MLLITALERLTRSEMEEEVVSEGVKHEQGMADDESFQNYKDGEKKLCEEEEIRDRIWQWAANVAAQTK